MPVGKSRAHVPLYWHILCEPPLVCRTVPTPTVSLEHEFFLKELFFYRYSGIASEIRLLIRFCGSCTSFEVLELFKVSIQSLILISEAIFVILNNKYREIQSEYAPMQQHPTSYRVHAYRANVRNTSCIKELRIRGSDLKHRGTGPDDLDHFLMCPITGLNPEAAESMELCFSMKDSYRVNIECISTIVLSGFPSCTSG
ncbi:hypothetical protein L1887_14864 [Cichorium endivia]|nr:hypothetical protein L1887_14864 [Cichorium endivia]